MFLLDTNVVSELRKARSGKANPNVVAWANSVEATSLCLSVVTVLELELGVLLAERRNPGDGHILRQWLESQVMPAFGNRIVSVDTAIARRAATLHVPVPRSVNDALIAATALVHRLSIVSRNVSAFSGMGVPLINPWEE